jgi:hypothetical protein
VRFERLQKPVVGVDIHRAQERVWPGYMSQHRVRRPTLAEEEQRRTIGLDDPDLCVEPADLNMAGSVGDRDDAVAGAEIHADCNRNHSKTALVTTHAKEKGYVSLPGELRSWQQNPWRRPEHFGNDLCRSARQTLNARMGTRA